LQHWKKAKTDLLVPAGMRATVMLSVQRFCLTVSQKCRLFSFSQLITRIIIIIKWWYTAYVCICGWKVAAALLRRIQGK
jgi:hypothetical protein